MSDAHKALKNRFHFSHGIVKISWRIWMIMNKIYLVIDIFNKGQGTSILGIFCGNKHWNEVLSLE